MTSSTVTNDAFADNHPQQIEKPRVCVVPKVSRSSQKNEVSCSDYPHRLADSGLCSDRGDVHAGEAR